MRELPRFGRWIFLSTAMTFVGMQGDRLVPGYALSIDALGLTSSRPGSLRVLNDLHGSAATSVVFPAWVEIVGRTRRNCRGNCGGRARCSMGSVAPASRPLRDRLLALFRLLYDIRYQSAARWRSCCARPGPHPDVLRSTATSASPWRSGTPERSPGLTSPSSSLDPLCRRVRGRWTLGDVIGSAVGTSCQHAADVLQDFVSVDATSSERTCG